jgi:hypothetical protein
MGRMFSYPDTHRYRIGPNYNQLPINAPHAPVRSYEIDGPMRYRHSGPEPTYAPNSYGGPQADERRAGEPSWRSDAAELGRYAYERHAGDDDFGQAGTLVRDVMSHVDRDHLVDNIVDHLSQGSAVRSRNVRSTTGRASTPPSAIALPPGSGEPGGSRHELAGEEGDVEARLPRLLADVAAPSVGDGDAARRERRDRVAVLVLAPGSQRREPHP